MSWLIGSILVTWGVMSLLWLHQLKTGNATWVDVAWAFGIGAFASVLAVHSDGDPYRRVWIALIVGAWSMRLGGHLFLDRVRSGVEDGRYARLRKRWGPGVFYAFYMAQAALIVLLPFSVWGALRNPAAFPSLSDAFGTGFWFLAWVGESVADRQLARFRADPLNRGKTCRSGLWRYSRHPNYFFELLIWCSYIPFSAGSGLIAWALLGPILLALLLTRVSGIPPTEEQALSSRGDDYRSYQRSTSALIPWFPKKENLP